MTNDVSDRSLTGLHFALVRFLMALELDKHANVVLVDGATICVWEWECMSVAKKQLRIVFK
jgi:hypothetical protein